MKNLHWYIIGALAVALVIVSLSKCNPETPEIGYARDSTQYWKTAHGQVVASLKQREDDFALTEDSYLDSIAKIHRTTAKRIQEVIRVNQRGEVKLPGQGFPVITYRDTGGVCPPQIASLAQLFVSPYYTASVALFPGYDSSTLWLQTYDTLSLVVKNVTEGGLFNRRHYIQMDARNANPHNLIAGIKAYRVAAPKPKKFGIGFQVGATLDGSGKIKPYVGTGIHYSLIRF